MHISIYGRYEVRKRYYYTDRAGDTQHSFHKRLKSPVDNRPIADLPPPRPEIRLSTPNNTPIVRNVLEEQVCFY